MNKVEAEDFVYKFYMEKSSYRNYDDKDANKRFPKLTREVIRRRAGTPCVVITGSKGKGSVANMIAQILQTEYKVGLMTSPHILDFCERIRIDGKPISDDDFATEMASIADEIEDIARKAAPEQTISPMGIQTFLALKYFQDKGTEFNVLECGKGAKYDDVNNALHQYAVINTIFAEHLRELGDTIEEIAADKAHVITGEQQMVYIAKQKPGVMNILLSRAKEKGVACKVYGTDFRAEKIAYTDRGMCFDIVVGDKKYEKIQIPLLGEHQAENCALAFAMCCDVMKNINLEIIMQRLLHLSWPGRMEVVSTQPLTILDACINRESCKSVKKVLEKLDIGNAAVIVGIPDDKDYLGVALEMRDISGKIILTKSQNPHYRFTDAQRERLLLSGIEAVRTASVEEALELAGGEAKPIVILGTTSVVGEVKKHYISY